ncbi:MAG: ABC transporter permease [Candidatus Omnitrophica bacterium]|nr:ABC transporter permease [Candidatus Omnitrophota bacterium]
MIGYIFRRLIGAIPVVFGITLISFFIIRIAPGKPTTIDGELNPKISPEVRQKLYTLYGLDKPLPIQYYLWLKRMLRIDFGNSFVDGRPVTEKILERIPLTVGINLISLICMFAIALPLGICSAQKPGGVFDNLTTIIVFIFFAAPTFWIALLLMQLICIHWGWLPISGVTSLDFEYLNWWQKIQDITRHLILPIFVTTLSGLAGISRYMRSSMIEVLNQPYILAAKAKGLPHKIVIYKHALRNAILPIVTLVGLSIPGLLGGSVIFESLFALPGLGRLFYEAVVTRDYPLIMAEVVLSAVLTLLGNLIADISYALVDPRIRYKK